MKIEYDKAKRERTLSERGLDMARTGEIFDGPTVTFEDDRFDYGETRLLTFGFLDERLVLAAWTQRGSIRRIISLRKANGREQRQYDPLLGR